MNPPANSDSEMKLFRQTLAALAYRAGNALRSAPDTFAEFSRGRGIAHADSNSGSHGRSVRLGALDRKGKQAWHDSKPLPWEKEVERFFAALRSFDDFLASGSPVEARLGKLFQGPVADALAHVGQLAILRRMAGAPLKGENYYKAEVTVGRVGEDQAKPKREF